VLKSVGGGLFLRRLWKAVAEDVGASRGTVGGSLSRPAGEFARAWRGGPTRCYRRFLRFSLSGLLAGRRIDRTIATAISGGGALRLQAPAQRLGGEAVAPALAAEAAHDQGAFWPMHDRLMKNHEPT
jgi:hypothetical protein